VGSSIGIGPDGKATIHLQEAAGHLAGFSLPLSARRPKARRGSPGAVGGDFDLTSLGNLLRAHRLHPGLPGQPSGLVCHKYPSRGQVGITRSEAWEALLRQEAQDSQSWCPPGEPTRIESPGLLCRRRRGHCGVTARQRGGAPEGCRASVRGAAEEGAVPEDGPHRRGIVQMKPSARPDSTR
jgi:hypothetical protein